MADKELLKKAVLRIRDVYPVPDFYPSRIPDLGSRISDPGPTTAPRGGGNFFVVLPFFAATNIIK
jgi:hypothetical protein